MIPIIGGLLASLASSGLGILKGAVEAKGKEAVEKIIGTKISDKPTSEELFKLKQLEAEHEQELMKLEIEKQKVDLEAFYAESEDRDSARSREKNIAVSKDAPLINKIATPSLAAFVVITWAAIQFYMLNHVVDHSMRELISRVLGTLDGALMLVLSYYFGASHDHKKDAKS